MPTLRRISVVDQAVAHLQQELSGGRWSERLPGVVRLAAECDVSTRVMRAALRQLEAKGLLAACGAGRSRSLVAPGKASEPRRSLRVAILLHDGAHDRQLGYMIELRHALEAAGHVTCFAQKSQVELNFEVRRISRHVAEIPADAWVVGTGSREVLEWFAAQAVPSIALFGRRSGLPIAAVGPDKVPAFVEATRELVRLGHQRIVLLCRKLRRLPAPGRVERAFLAELAAHDLPVSPSYNLPDWEETLAGFHRRLASMFRVSPPTALIIDEAPLFAAVLQFLAGRGLRVPEHVSLVCTDHDPTFEWCAPPISHMQWDAQPIVRRIVRWAAAVSRGRPDRVQTLFPAEFVRGATIGPAPPPAGKGLE